jgi:hypothetical protein
MPLTFLSRRIGSANPLKTEIVADILIEVGAFGIGRQQLLHGARGNSKSAISAAVAERHFQYTQRGQVPHRDQAKR